MHLSLVLETLHRNAIGRLRVIPQSYRVETSGIDVWRQEDRARVELLGAVRRPALHFCIEPRASGPESDQMSVMQQTVELSGHNERIANALPCSVISAF